MKNDPSALLEARTFGRFEAPTFFTSLASGAVLSAGVGSGDKALIYSGVGTFALSLLLDQLGYLHLKKAVKIFNRGERTRAAVESR